MLYIKEAVVVEGNHDKIKLSQIVGTLIIATNGFAVYGNKRMINLLKTLAQKRGLIILTDSDSSGKRIRSYIKNCIGDIPVKHAYIPQIQGKERRKAKAGAENLLGVEGMDDETLKEVLLRAGCMTCSKNDEITKTHLYEDGLTGASNSKQFRQELAKKINFPPNLSSNALLEVLNSLYTYEEYKELLKK